MRLPKQISIAGHDVKIVYKNGLIFDGTKCWGIYDDINHTIYLQKGMDRTRKMEIFLHECLHAIEHIHVLNMSEKFVKILGIELLAIIRNNRINFLERKRATK